MKLLKVFSFVLFLIYFAVAVLLFSVQRDMLYRPSVEENHPYITESFPVNGENIKVIVLNQDKNDAILYFGGNGESVARGAAGISSALPDHAIYLVNYRGYGGSSGEPTEKGIYADAQAIYDIVSQDHETLSVVGQSLGTGVATYLASTRPVTKTVLIAPYDSIQHVVQDMYPIFPMPVLLLDKYRSIDRVDQISSPTLILIAELDELIPAKYSNLLIEKFPEALLRVEIIEGVGHNDIGRNPRYFSLLKEFI